MGRKAPTADIGLQKLSPGGFLEVDERMRVRGVSWLYATGDINGRAQFTHKGTYQARIALDHILGDRTAVADRRGGGLLADACLADPRSIARGAPRAGRRHTLTP